MTSRSDVTGAVRSNFYAIMSLHPITEDRAGTVVYCCIPVDCGPDGTVREDTRYCTLLFAPPTLKAWGLLSLYEDERAYSYQWLTFCWGGN